MRKRDQELTAVLKRHVDRPLGKGGVGRDGGCEARQEHPGEVRPQNRLRSRADFDRTSRSGRRVARAELVLYHADGGAGVPRFGFAVGHRLGGAVVRNRIRRRLREAIRPLLDDLLPSDLVIVARAPAVSAGVADLREVLRSAADEAGLLRRAAWLHNGGTDPDV